jgi:hypothetical protein
LICPSFGYKLILNIVKINIGFLSVNINMIIIHHKI